MKKDHKSLLQSSVQENDFNELLVLLRQPLSKQHILMIASLVEKRPDLLQYVFEVIKSKNQKDAMRASWLLSHLWDRSPQLLRPFQHELTELLFQTNSDSVRRNILRILDGMPVNESDMGNLIDVCIQWMLSENHAIAVRCNAMQILFRICQVEPDLSGEVKACILALNDYGSAGFKSRANKIVKQLKALQPD
ncbi:MAG: hypothetical protein Q7V19_16935 [Bacteroidales bacterium]|nr:hypothetical protein [Bacteroidales bacterium]